MVLKAESEVGRERGYGSVGGSPLNIDALGSGDGDEGSMSAVQSLSKLVALSASKPTSSTHERVMKTA